MSHIDDHVREFQSGIEDAEICKPAPGEFIDDCHYSKTGFAIWRQDTKGKWCTCIPAEKPE